MSSDFSEWQNKPIREMQKLNLHLGLSKRIAYDNGLTGASITGIQQGGKSSYGLIVLWELFNHDVDKVLEHVVFRIEDFTAKIKQALQTHQRMRCLMLDDASLFASAARYNVNRKLVLYLSGLGDTLGVATKGIILTSPSGDLIKALRNYQFYKVQIGQGRHHYDRIARGYKQHTKPSGQKWVSSEFHDCYDIRTTFYERYAAMREDISLTAVTNIETFMNQEPKRPEIIEHDGRRYVEVEIDD